MYCNQCSGSIMHQYGHINPGKTAVELSHITKQNGVNIIEDNGVINIIPISSNNKDDQNCIK